MQTILLKKLVVLSLFSILFLSYGCNQTTEEEAVTFTVTYNANGGSGTVPGVGTYEEGETVTAAGYGTLTRTGYTFDGWNTKADGTGTRYVIGSAFPMGAADVNLYAIWSNTGIGSWFFRAATTADQYEYDDGLFADTIIADMADDGGIVIRFYLDTEQVHGTKGTYALVDSDSVNLEPTHDWNVTTKAWDAAPDSLATTYGFGTYSMTITMPEYTGPRALEFGRVFFTKPANLVGTWNYASGGDTRTFTLRSDGTFDYAATGSEAMTETGTWDVSSALGLFRSLVLTHDGTAMEFGWVNPYALNGSVMTMTEDDGSSANYTKQ